MSFQQTRDKAKAVVSQLPVTLHVCPTKGLRMWTTRRLHFPCTCIFTNPLCSLSGQLYTSPNTGIFLFKMIQQTLSLVYLLWIWFLYFCLRPLIILERSNTGSGSDHSLHPHEYQRRSPKCSWPRGLMTPREEESRCIQSVNSKICPQRKNDENLVYGPLWLLESTQPLTQRWKHTERAPVHGISEYGTLLVPGTVPLLKKPVWLQAFWRFLSWLLCHKHAWEVGLGLSRLDWKPGPCETQNNIFYRTISW